MPGGQRFVVPSRFYPTEGFPVGTPYPEFPKSRSSHDKAGTSGGDVTIVQVIRLNFKRSGDSPVAFRRRSPRRILMDASAAPEIEPEIETETESGTETGAFRALDRVLRTSGPAALLDQLVEQLTERGETRALLDAV